MREPLRRYRSKQRRNEWPDGDQHRGCTSALDSSCSKRVPLRWAVSARPRSRGCPLPQRPWSHIRQVCLGNPTTQGSTATYVVSREDAKRLSCCCLSLRLCVGPIAKLSSSTAECSIIYTKKFSCNVSVNPSCSDPSGTSRAGASLTGLLKRYVFLSPSAEYLPRVHKPTTRPQMTKEIRTTNRQRGVRQSMSHRTHAVRAIGGWAGPGTA